jgi:hypothetical protein
MESLVMPIGGIVIIAILNMDGYYKKSGEAGAFSQAGAVFLVVNNGSFCKHCCFHLIT